MLRAINNSFRGLRRTSARDEQLDLKDPAKFHDDEQKSFDLALKTVLAGTQILKVGGNGRLYSRIFLLDPDYQTIQYREPHYRYPMCQSKARIVDLNQVKEVRTGYKTDIFHLYDDDKKFVVKYPEDRCFSLILSGGRTVNLIAPSTEICKQWTNVIQHIIGKTQNENREVRLEKYLKRQFKLADTSKDGFLNLEECMKLLSHLNLQFTKDQASHFFKAAGAFRQPGTVFEVLDAEGFHRFYKLLSERADLREIFSKHASEPKSEVWTVRDLHHFLQSVQKEDEQTVESCEFLIQTFEPVEENQAAKLLSLNGFRNYLLNQRQFLFDNNKRQVYHDMTHPLKDYFIASSHNTYLTTNQLTGTSSVEAYVYCFLRGCRCVELDCWDSAEGEPIITHGHTLTSRIFFRDVVNVIKEYGFRASPYPIILSIENHCSVEQQDVMAKHLTEILGDMLYCEEPKETDTQLPSPDALRNRVIMKAKKVRALDQLDSLPSQGEDDDLAENAVDGADVDSPVMSAKDKKLQAKVSQLLSNGTYLAAVKFRGYDHFKANGKFFQISSLSESKSMGLVEESRHSMIKHTQRQLLRIYPDGLRTGSSNYDPIPLLHSGCQIVALNYQDKRPETHVYKAMFADNGGCGYLLKPEWMRKEEHDLEAYESRILPMRLCITIISGQQLPKPDGIEGADIADPYVTVQIFGSKRDSKKEKTKFIRNNGFSPIWNQSFEFVIHDQEMAVARFEVKDFDTKSTNELIAHYTIPVVCMKEGYRHLELLDKQDASLDPATIFIQVEKKPFRNLADLMNDSKPASTRL